MTFPKLFTLTCALATLFFVSGCAPEKENAVHKPSHINATYVKAPLNIPSIVEKKTHVFEELFQQEKIPFTYSSITEGPKQTAAMEAGDIDIAHALGGTSAILAKANGVDLRIVGMYSRAPQAFVIVSKRDDIKTVADLTGKTVIGPKGTNLHQLLLMALAEQNMNPTDVNFISAGIPQAAAAMENGSADAALLAGPLALKATEQGAHIIRDAQGLLNAGIVIAVRGEFMDKYPEQVKAFLQTHTNVVAKYKQNPAEFFPIAAEETKLTPAQVETMAAWYDFDTAVQDKDIKDLEKAQDFLISAGLLKEGKRVNIRSMFQQIP